MKNSLIIPALAISSLAAVYFYPGQHQVCTERMINQVDNHPHRSGTRFAGNHHDLTPAFVILPAAAEKTASILESKEMAAAVPALKKINISFSEAVSGLADQEISSNQAAENISMSDSGLEAADAEMMENHAREQVILHWSGAENTDSEIALLFNEENKSINLLVAQADFSDTDQQIDRQFSIDQHETSLMQE